MAYARIIVLLGVAGSGKTTVGVALAKRLGIAFEDGDALHSPASVEKMRRGEPLTQADREPWLRIIGEWMDFMLSEGKSGVMACSGLYRASRDGMRDDRPVKMAFLRLSREVAEERVRNRAGHYFQAEMLPSQFAALEEPGPDEDVLILDATLPVDQLVERLSGL
jgi:gluconokinase